MNIGNNFLILLKSDDDYQELIFNGTIDNLKEAYILCKYSFKDQNFNVDNLSNHTNIKIPEITRLNFTFNEIMSFKLNKIDFYIISKERLQSILKKTSIKFEFNTYIYFFDKLEDKILYFLNENKYIGFKIKHFGYVNINNQFIKDNINIINQAPKGGGDYANSICDFRGGERKVDVIRSLILIYVNEKIIIELYSKGIYDLKNCYLVNKSWIDKFKELFFFNEISNILTIKGINTYKSVLKYLQILESSNEISTIKNKINVNTNALIQNDLSTETKNIGESKFPINFVIINDKLRNLIENFSNSAISPDYEISFGISALYIRLKNDLNKIYYYNYNNNSFNLSGIIEVLIPELWKDIYDRHLSKKSFIQFLNEKQINLNMKNQKQEIFSSRKRHLGYIYLPSPIIYKNDNAFNIIKLAQQKSINNYKQFNTDNLGIDDLREQLNEERNKNKLLEDKIKELNNTINRLEQDNNNIIKQYDGEIRNYINKIEQLNNYIKELSFENKNLKSLINAPNNLNNNDSEIVRLYKKIEDLNEKINRYPFILEKDETMLSIIFMSVSQKVNYSMICKNTDTINKLEPELYKKYPELSETDNYFLCKGTVINRFKKIKELNIKNGDIIIMNQREE